nr:protein NDR1-like [Tanacetum cinerariifolium]GFB67152.1 protein NDR1-like [Tanacetum cinerariifolium]
GYHKRHPMTLAATVEVDDKTGVKVGDKAIRMVNSGAWDHKQAMFLPVSILLSDFPKSYGMLLVTSKVHQ